MYSDIIEANTILKSNITDNAASHTKITYFGASGEIGRNVLSSLIDRIPNGKTTIVLFAHSTANLIKLDGLAKELQQKVELLEKDIVIKYTNNSMETAGSDVILCSTDVKPSQEMNALESIPSKVIRSFANKESIENIARIAKEYSPKSAFVVATNQTDLVAQIAREAAPGLKVFGLTGMVDSTRLRNEYYAKTRVKLDSGLIVGLHNLDQKDYTMFPVESSLHAFDNSIIDMDSLAFANSQIKGLGGQIAKKLSTDRPPEFGIGPHILPGAGFVQFVMSYCYGEKTLVESWNRKIETSEDALFWDLQIGAQLSLPMVINKDSITPCFAFLPNEKEKAMLKQALAEIDLAYEQMKSINILKAKIGKKDLDQSLPPM
ncbi:MAG: hypothetical protein GX638_14770 [Crenarchaeota archaeon]|nr:hypothetical protein [Thermoproteota archaeon]